MTTALLSSLFFHGNQASAMKHVIDHQGFAQLDGPVAEPLPGRGNHPERTQYRQPIPHGFVSRRCLRQHPHQAFTPVGWPGLPGLRGQQAALLRRYFYGFRVQVITTDDGVPVDFHGYAGSFVDVTDWQSMNLDLPAGSELYADSGYTDYEIEDLLPLRRSD